MSDVDETPRSDDLPLMKIGWVADGAGRSVTDQAWISLSDGGYIQIEDTACADQLAVLIAAAPSMARALREVAVLGHGKCTIGKPLAQMIRAALASAEARS